VFGLLFGLSLVLRKRHPFADDFAARLVFPLHAQSFALNGDRRQHKAASAASGLGKAIKIRPPQFISSVPFTNPPEEKNERGRNPAE
jgi:hypothetical protein